MSKWPIAMVATVLFAATAWAEPAAPRDLSMYKEAPVSGGGLLVAAYAVMWLLVAAAVWRLMRAPPQGTWPAGSASGRGP